MAEAAITYAKAGVAPDPFPFGKLRDFDLETGQEVLDVEEVNTTEGWLISYKRNATGEFYIDPASPEEVARQRVVGRFEIRSVG